MLYRGAFRAVDRLLSQFTASEIIKEIYALPEGPQNVGENIALAIRAHQKPPEGESFGWARRVLAFGGEDVATTKETLMVEANSQGAYVESWDGDRPVVRVVAAEPNARAVPLPPVRLPSLPSFVGEAPTADDVDRCQALALQELLRAEDLSLRSLFDVLTEPVYVPDLSLRSLAYLRYQLEKRRVPLHAISLSRAQIGELFTSDASTQLDPETRRDHCLRGTFAHWLGASIITCSGIGVEEVIPSRHVYLTTHPSLMTSVQELVTVFSEPWNKEASKVRGWLCAEVLCMGLGDARGIVHGVIKPGVTLTDDVRP